MSGNMVSVVINGFMFMSDYHWLPIVNSGHLWYILWLSNSDFLLLQV